MFEVVAVEEFRENDQLVYLREIAAVFRSSRVGRLNAEIRAQFPEATAPATATAPTSQSAGVAPHEVLTCATALLLAN
ncbi:MAG: hypothetical protein ACREVG_00655 [Burkholderiales bacterium]